MTAPDRLKLLLAQNKVTGIDFVYVEENQTALKVFFHHDDPTKLDTSLQNLKTNQISIVSKSTGVEVLAKIDSLWPQHDGKRVMRLTVDQPGDFSVHILRIEDERIDSRYNNVEFSFKAVCDSELDCQPHERTCPAETLVDFPVDYQARDFWSFRRALLDFASQRYPDWHDRLEADMGVMLVEVMSALGDELAYYQDRIAREAHLETATQRRSLRHHTKLIDYPMHEGLAASTWLDVTVKPDQKDILKAGDDVWAVSDNGEQIHYEIGNGLFDVDKKDQPSEYSVDAKRNKLVPHIWDEDETCLQAGSISLYVEDHQKSNLLPFNDPPENPNGRWVLLKTQPKSADIPARRWRVRLTKVEEDKDPLIKHPKYGHKITKLTWEKAQALPFEMDMTVLEVRGNLVPATAGKTEPMRRFVVGQDPNELKLSIAEQQSLTRAIERQGPSGSPAYLFSLLGSDKTPLCWRGVIPQMVRPEVRLVEVEWKNGAWSKKQPAWDWRTSFLGSPASRPYQQHFVLEDGSWDRIVGYQRSGKEIVHRDYVGDDGKTIRFGDGEFGLIPRKESVFEVSYRLGNGRRGNLAADSLKHFDRQALSFLEAISNPIAVTDGADAETPGKVRQLAPDAFRAVTYRAVQAKDYAEAAERLDWVQRAGARFRWTGSWLTAFVTPDPLGSVSLTQNQRQALTDQIDRFRQAGREAHVMASRYADIDLEIIICVEPNAFPGQVKERVLEALLGRTDLNKKGFFDPDNFTFGTPLRRSKLEAVITQVAGVLAVRKIEIRRRGYFDWIMLTKPYFTVSDQDVIRLENDPNYPERGTLTLKMEGGS
jgi:hypothetical protein